MAPDVSALVDRSESLLREGQLVAAASTAEDGLRGSPPAEERARLQLVAAAVDRLQGRGLIASERLQTEAALVAKASPVTAARLLCEASRAAFDAADTTSALATANEAVRLTRRAPSDVRAEAELALAVASLLGGAADAEALVEDVLDRTRSSPPTLLGSLHGSSAVLFWAERYDEARRVLELVIRRARRFLLMGLLPVALDTLGAVEFRTGRWAAAEARSTEALRLGREYSGAFETASFHTTLARLEAARGRRPEAERHLHAAASLCGDELIGGFHATALALLELSLGRPGEAAAALERLSTGEAAQFEPNVLRWEADFVEALIRAGRQEEAAAALGRFGRRAHATRRAWTQAALHRCRGLLAPADGYDDEFAEALRWHAQSPMPFERARTELCYAERLRRVRRSTEARAHFRSALGTFEHLGAEPWAVRARRGLAGRAARRRPSRLDVSLTPHESQVVGLVQRGATNKEVAATLFVTEKTVEYHLSNVFRKLGVRSRSELIWLLAGRSSSGDPPERAARRTSD